MEKDRLCVRFKLGDQSFGLPLAELREIVHARAIAGVPLAPAAVRGLLSMRGRVITLLDPAALLGLPLPPARRPTDQLGLLLAAPWEHVGLYVHAPAEILRARGAAVVAGARSAAATASAGDDAATEPGSRGLARELAPVNGGLIQILSARDLLARCDASVLDLFRRRAPREVA
jgi:chemotaxis signal transduction protein